jgi:hypothetical protein
MHKSIGDLLYGVGEKILDYLPNLLGGLVLVAVGWLLGWVAKRIVVQLCVVFRPDRTVRRFAWGRGFDKADVRYALYDMIGNGAFVVVFLVLLNAAFAAMRLGVLSELLQRGVLFIPRFLIALLIIGFGTLIAGWTSLAIHRGLANEHIPRAMLIARLAKAVLVLFFAAMALTELDLARQIVLVGFTTVIVTICLLVVLALVLDGRDFMKRFREMWDEEETHPEPR